MEYWIEGKAVFKLDAIEVRFQIVKPPKILIFSEQVKQVLTRRIDFSIDSINALKL